MASAGRKIRQEQHQGQLAEKVNMNYLNMQFTKGGRSQQTGFPHVITDSERDMPRIGPWRLSWYTRALTTENRVRLI